MNLWIIFVFFLLFVVWFFLMMIPKNTKFPKNVLKN